jgi:hypothetical protein
MYSMLSLGKYPSKIHRVRASIPAHRARAVLLFWIIAYSCPNVESAFRRFNRNHFDATSSWSSRLEKSNNCPLWNLAFVFLDN